MIHLRSLDILEQIGVELPAMAISEGPSLDRIALDLVDAVVAGPGRDVAQELADRHLTGVAVPEEVKSRVMGAAGGGGA